MSTWQEDSRINRARLDYECERMPEVYGHWQDNEQRACAAEDRAAHALLLAEDAMKKSQAKAHLQLRGWSIAKINRELGTEIDPTRPSLSEQIYKDLTLIHPMVLEAEAELNNARIEFMTAKAHRREMQSARYTMDIKDKALKKLVDIGDRLFGMSGSYQPRHSARPYAGQKAAAASNVTGVAAAINAYRKNEKPNPAKEKSLIAGAGRIKE